MQAGIFEYGNGTLAFNAGGAIAATAEYLPNPYQITYNNIPVKSGVTVTSMTKTDWQGTYTLSTSARTNLCLQSQAIDQAAWTLINASVSANALTAPDYSLTGDKLVENSSTATHYLTQSLTFTAAACTFSIFVKASERKRILLRENSATGAAATFDLSLGSVVATESGGSGAISSIGNGWYRCSMTSTPGAGAKNIAIYLLPDSGSGFASVSYAGDGVSGIYLWGAQFEASATATSYIPTTTATVTATDYSVTVAGVATLGTNYWPGQYAWTGTGTQLPYCVTGPTNRYNRMAVGISGLGAETVSMYPSYDGQIWESNALRPIDLSTGAVYGSTTLANGTYRIHDTPWKGVLFMASAATSGAVRYSLLNAN